MVNNNSILSTTTQSFDRFVGTAAVIGLSLVVVLHSWISAPSEEDYEENDVVEEAGCSNQQQQVHNTAAAASPSRRKVNGSSKSAITTTKSWWWPVAILTRRKKKRRKRIRKQHDGNNDNIANHTTNRHDSHKANEDSSYDDDDDDGYCDHLGSCECGSIQFILKGPKHLQPITSPGRIHYPHIQTSATNFQLLKGEADMRFQYVQETNNEEEDYDNNNTTSSANNTNGDDTSTIATEHIEKHHASSLGAHVFCGNCGVHVMHADRSSEELEVNANCLLEKKKEQQQQQQPSSVEEEERKTEQRQEQQIQKQTSSMSSLSTIDGDTTTTTDPATLTRSLSQQQHQLNSVSEHELFLGGSAQFWSELDNSQFNTSGDNNNNNNNNKPQELENSQHARTESISSTGEQTHPSSYTNTPTYEGDDYSIDGSLLAPPGGGGGGGGASVVSASLSVNAGLLPPLPPSRLPPLSSTSDSKSVRTLPPWFGERPGYASHPARSVGGGWSVASMETNDLDSVGGESTTIVSPRMRDQMKFYMSRHMKKDKKKSERSGSV